MTETRTGSIGRPTSCGTSGSPTNSPGAVSSFAFSRFLSKCPRLDPSLGHGFFHLPNVSKAIVECRIEWPETWNSSSEKSSVQEHGSLITTAYLATLIQNTSH